MKNTNKKGIGSNNHDYKYAQDVTMHPPNKTTNNPCNNFLKLSLPHKISNKLTASWFNHTNRCQHISCVINKPFNMIQGQLNLRPPIQVCTHEWYFKTLMSLLWNLHTTLLKSDSKEKKNEAAHLDVTANKLFWTGNKATCTTNSPSHNLSGVGFYMHHKKINKNENLVCTQTN